MSATGGSIADDTGSHAATATADDRVTHLLGIRVGRRGPGAHDGATAVTGTATWTDGGGSTDGDTVPTAALLALVDAAARAAAQAAVTGTGRTATLVPTATGVQFRERVHGPVTATATVPADGDLVARADDRGMFRFSVAVEVVGPRGARAATGSVQWVARLDPIAGLPRAQDAPPA